MLVGGVVGHQVEDQLQAARVCVGEQGVEIGQRAKERVMLHVVGYVVAKVVHGRRVDGREPDRVDVQAFDIVQPLRMPGRSPTPSWLLS
jgi:hypothetical protein